MQKKVGILKLDLVSISFWFLIIAQSCISFLWIWGVIWPGHSWQARFDEIRPFYNDNEIQTINFRPHQTLQITDSMKCAFCPPSRKAAVCTAASRNLTTSVSPGDSIGPLCWIGRSSECAVSVRNEGIRHTGQCCQSSKKCISLHQVLKSKPVLNDHRDAQGRMCTRDKRQRGSSLSEKKDLNLFVCSFWTVA